MSKMSVDDKVDRARKKYDRAFNAYEAAGSKSAEEIVLRRAGKKHTALCIAQIVYLLAKREAGQSWALEMKDTLDWIKNHKLSPKNGVIYQEGRRVLDEYIRGEDAK
jgi:hypothetical protein